MPLFHVLFSAISVGSDCDDFDAFSAQQFELSLSGVQTTSAFDHKILFHMDNSALELSTSPTDKWICVNLDWDSGINPRNNKTIKQHQHIKDYNLPLHHRGRRALVTAEDNPWTEQCDKDYPNRLCSGLDRHLSNRHGCCLVGADKKPNMLAISVRMYGERYRHRLQRGDSVEIFGDHLPVMVLEVTSPRRFLTRCLRHKQSWWRVYFQD